MDPQPEQTTAPVTASQTASPPPARSRLTGATVCWLLLFVTVASLVAAAFIHFKKPPNTEFETLLLIVASAALALLLLIKVPQWQVAGLAAPDLERFDAENEARTTFAQILGGVGLIAGLYFTNLQIRETQRAATNSEALIRDGQITDRYVKAVQLLGANDLQNVSARVGAIFALERIAKESKLDHWPIIELLTGYVRERSRAGVDESHRWKFTKLEPAMPFLNGSLWHGTDVESGRAFYVVTVGLEPFRPVSAEKISERYIWESWVDEPVGEDVQAAMTVIGRRSLSYESDDPRRLNLRNANLRGINLEAGHFEGADLQGANLQGANLTGTCLSGAALAKAYLVDLTLQRTDFRRADLTNAVLLNDDARDVDLREATLVGVFAPVHSVPNKKGLPFVYADARGARQDGSTERLPGAVVVSEDDEPKYTQPYPPAKSGESCLQRSAPMWFKNDAPESR